MRARNGRFILTVLLVSFMMLTGTMASAQEDPSTLSCSPENPTASANLTCQADGLQGDSTAQWSAEFAGGSTDSGEATADANGSAQFQLDVPDEPGEYTITVEGVAADGAAYSESFSGEVRAQGADDDDDEDGDEGEGNDEDDEAEDEDEDEGEGNGQGEGNGEGGEGEGQGQEKISLCHATASDTNPYVFITVGGPAATKGGHANHEGDIIPADGPEDCPFGEAVLSCISTAGIASEDANPILCRVMDMEETQAAEWEATCPDGSSRSGVLAAEDGEARFDFACPTGDFDVFVLGSDAEGEVVFEESGAGVAGVFFGDEEAAPAPPPQVEEVPIGPVAAGYGGTAEPDHTGWLVALGLFAVAALSFSRLGSAGQRGSRQRQ